MARMGIEKLVSRHVRFFEQNDAQRISAGRGQRHVGSLVAAGSLLKCGSLADAALEQIDYSGLASSNLFFGAIDCHDFHFNISKLMAVRGRVV